MPPLIIPNAVQVVATGSLAGGENWANVWHVMRPGATQITQTAADLIAAGVWQFYDTVKQHRFTGWTMNQITVRDLTTQGANVFIGTVTPITGTGPTTALPYECAAVITLHTELNTRRGRGRSYQAGFGSSATGTTAGGAPMISANVRTTLAAGMTAMMNFLANENFDLGVASRSDVNIRKVLSGYIDSNWDTQRGRSNSIPATRTSF